MNKYFAQALDKCALRTMSGKFNMVEDYREKNIKLVVNPPIPPRSLDRKPRLFMKPIVKKSFYEVHQYTFHSQIETVSFTNNIVHGRMYKLTSMTPKSTVILLHALNQSSRRSIRRMTRSFLRSGHNCITVSLPYHYERSSKRRNAAQPSPDNLERLFEGLQQGVKDVLSLVYWLDSMGHNRIGVVGIQLGGLIAGIVSSISRKIAYTVLVTPATSALNIAGFAADPEITGLSKEQLEAINKSWDLTTLKPVVPQDRIFVIGAEYDKLVPKSSIWEMWRAWGQPRMYFYRHGHISLRNAKQPVEDINRFVRDLFDGPKPIGLFR